MGNIILNGFTIQDLKNELKEIFSTKDEISKIIEQTTQKNSLNEVLLTTDEACKLLKIDPSTLWAWQKKGKVNVYKLANKNYYKKSEILESLRLKK